MELALINLALRGSEASLIDCGEMMCRHMVCVCVRELFTDIL